ncbi:acetyltransferase [Penicillium pulvis]|uniref:acetyltransferase n=1 Tax=Penicillium pulvis TaxID=1562058 RepID=UPI00254673FD|nr:acetyltransferase [Penicillium pulvis]KAJ5809120.1 acetyltransferase [Penicillium pulvis]
MSSHDSGVEAGTEHSPSRFTAVNGKDSSISAKMGSSVPPRERAPSGSGVQERSRPEIPEQEHSPEDHGSQRSSPETSTQTHKRKRSTSSSREHGSRHPSELGGTARSSTGHPIEFSAPPNSNGAGPGSVSDMESGPNGPSRSDLHESSQISSNGPWPEYDSQLVSQAQRAQQMDASDAQLADALQREAHSQDPSHRNVNVSRSTPAPTVQSSSSPAYSSERPTTAVQVAPKRKRVFSNRTKTGCMTCRRRKKKCDEQHPACNNCLRGGFLCEGYSSRSTWQKPSSSKAPVPLQSKEGYPEINGQYVPETHHDRQLAEHIVDSRKMRPIVVEDERAAPQYNTSPTETGSSHHPSWSKRPWPNTGHSAPAYPSEHVAKGDYREVPSIHELPRDTLAKPDYPAVPPIREISHGPPPKANMPLLFQGAVAPPVPATAMDTNSPQVQARMALSIENQLSSRTASSDDTEMDKMMKGDLYRPFDVQLVEERDRCRRALARFNNACNPLSGLSSKEQNRLLKEIMAAQPTCTLKPPGSPGMSTPTMRRPTPSLGPGAIVESPFTCHYGYLSIGEDVMISHDCVFVDDCFIFVGAHTWVGPNVTILTTMAHSSMQERKGTQSRYEGRRVRIMEDCYIGAGSTIYPGVTLGRGAYIAPGEVVRSDVVPYGFQGFKPNYM